ncbi:hypothetical protein D3C84_1292660 [compost metagenome]
MSIPYFRTNISRFSEYSTFIGLPSKYCGSKPDSKICPRFIINKITITDFRPGSVI